MEVVKPVTHVTWDFIKGRITEVGQFIYLYLSKFSTI